MSRRTPLLLLLVLALTSAGCAAANTSSKNFQGTERDVATAIDDLGSAGKRKDESKICTQLLTRELAQQMKAAGATCEQEMSDAMADADDYDLKVKDVTVTGPTATAQVENNDNTYTMRLQKVGADWRVASLGS
jgi:Spy/CpxP family protein refolding chaperone